MLALLLAGCGGGGDDASTTTSSSAAASTGTTTGATTGTTAGSTTGGTAASTTNTATGNQFTAKATWTMVEPAAGTSVCYDFAAATEVAGCTGTAWDVKITGTQRGGVQLFTNSGPSGTGQGGVYAGNNSSDNDLIDWTDLLKWQNGNIDPATGARVPTRLYFPDSTVGAFSGKNAIGSAAFEYNLSNDHRLYPSYRVFLITTNRASDSTTGTAAQPVYALQLTGYYGGDTGTASGYPRFRWVNRAVVGSAAQEKQVNASNGTVYFNLETGTEVAQSGTWHVAFNRYQVSLNPAGTLGAAVGITPTDFYEADGDPIKSALSAATPESTLSYLTSASLPATAQWQSDRTGSRLNPTVERESNGTFDFGWYKYYPTAELAQAAGLSATAHLLSADASEGALIRGGDGASFARMHLTNISYQNPGVATSQRTWTFEFDVQPATAQ